MNRLIPLPSPPVACWLVLLMCWQWTPVSLLAAEPLQVNFASSYTAECVDITPAEFALTNPDQRIVEARFRVSVLLTGNEADLEELLLVVSSPQRRLRVVDFLPKTETFSDVTGPIEVVENTDKNQSVEAKVGGGVSAHYGVANVQVAPSLGAGASQHRGTKECYQKLPPRSLVLASGTTEGEHGVFYKLKPSSQATLEGAREYVCAFVVPRHWQADWVMLTCEAKAYTRHYLSRRLETCGHTRVYVGLYQQGDVVARMAANHLAETQSRLLQPGGPAPGLPAETERAGAVHIASAKPSTAAGHPVARLGDLFAWCERVNPFEAARPEPAVHQEAAPSAELALQAALTTLARLAGE